MYRKVVNPGVDYADFLDFAGNTLPRKHLSFSVVCVLDSRSLSRSRETATMVKLLDR